MKVAREDKKRFKQYRAQVIHNVETLQGAPVDGSERRALEKKPFLPVPLQREVVEVLCDFVTARQSQPVASGAALRHEGADELPAVRAIWYLLTRFRPRAVTPDQLDPYAEVPSRDVFGFDIRAFRNVKIVFEVLLLYVAEAKLPFFPDRELDAYLGAGQVNTETVKTLAASMSEPCYYSLQRICQLFAHLARDNVEVEKEIAELFAETFIRSPMVAVTEASIDLRRQTLLLMMRDVDAVWPKPYPSTRVRLGQGIHYQPKFFAQNEIEIFLEGSTPATYHEGDVVLEENQPNWALYRVKSGSFKVFVGESHVATLIAGDWFGETSLLSLHVAHARIVCSQKNSDLNIVSSVHLNTIFKARPDLAATFFSVMAYELATRFNVALLQFGRTNRRDELSVDPKSGSHVVRTIVQPRTRDESKETTFRYEADIHAVKAIFCKRVPKKAKKEPREAILYMFAARIAVLYQKGHHQKRTEIPLGWVQNVMQKADAADEVVIEYLEYDKDHKTILLKLNTPEAAKHVVEFESELRASFQGQVGPMPSLAMTRALAMFAFSPSDASSQIALVPGREYTVLDRTGGWLYGFDDEVPDNKGLFPLAHVELRPFGALTSGVMMPDDWDAISSEFETLQLNKGDVLIKEGDPTQSGHLYFFQTGSFAVEKIAAAAGGAPVLVNTVGPGESVGELLFLLGGCPRATVKVASASATVKKLPRKNLTKLLEDTKFSARFWKFLCCMMSSRLFHLQLRLTNKVPPLPQPVKLVFGEKDKAERPLPPDAPPSLVTPPLVVAKANAMVNSDVPSTVQTAPHPEEIQSLINSLQDMLSSSEGDDLEDEIPQ